MKYLTLILLTIVTLTAKAQLPSTELYEQFVLKVSPAKAPKGYGFSPDKPVTVGIYADMTDQQKTNSQTARFYKTFVWPDGSPVDLSERSSVMINDVNLNKYLILKPGTKDTMTLYVDMYKDAPISIPEGFGIYSKQQLATDLAPVIARINMLDTVADKYTSAQAKELSFTVLGYLQRTIGLGYVMDKDNLDPLMSDEQADIELKALLLRSYISHKLAYAATDQPNVKNKAYNAMVADYLAVTKKHPEIPTGKLAALMKPKP